MKLIVGLGNPGPEYENTRHNIGFMVVDKLGKEWAMGAGPTWKKDEKRNVLTVKYNDILLAKPLTFMNGSGYAVRALMDYYRLKPSDVWIIHDDLDLPIGKIKIREKGASAGHRGVASVIESLGTDGFVRFRLGIGRDLKHSNVISFVLSRFRQSEAGEFKHLIKHAVEAVQYALDHGIERAMNQHN